MERTSLLCKVFGHRFVTVADCTKEPINSEIIGASLESIRNNTSTVAIEIELQRKVLLNKEESKHVKTYCKRCGMVV